ncbi:MAG: AAA family ATPase [Leptospiraceae bacterium]|nr:AAA family ATPase [Leptospiraceae bacterium]
MKIPGITRGYGLARFKYEKEKKIDFSFNEIEFLARKLTKEKSELEFWIFYKLIEAEKNGGICVSRNIIEEFLSSKGISFSLNDLDSIPVILDNDNVYLKKTHFIENNLIEKVKNLLDKKISNLNKLDYDKKFSTEQIEVIKNCLNHSICFLTGGPGTGKTTILKSVLSSCLLNGIHEEDILVLAPTGKAAKRFLENSVELFQNFPNLKKPRTIHSALGWNPSTGKTTKNEENPFSEKLFIIDESSMVDIFVMEKFLSALDYTKEIRVILSGDSDQLLSIDSGMIFSDLVACEKNVFRLTKTFRQGHLENEISKLANVIKNSQVPILSEYSKEVIFEDTKDENFDEKILNWYKQHISTNAQILSPFNKDIGGVSHINQLINESREIEVTKIGFKLGSPLIALKNIPELDILNGETGILFQEGNEIKFMNSENKELIFYSHLRNFFQLSYCITIHKSQGSEYDHVCLVLPEAKTSPKLSILNKRLIYTAITRAKRTITIFGSQKTWEEIFSKNEIKRQSGIIRKIQDQ